jgi:hypothetical protein
VAALAEPVAVVATAVLVGVEAVPVFVAGATTVLATPDTVAPAALATPETVVLAALATPETVVVTVLVRVFTVVLAVLVTSDTAVLTVLVRVVAVVLAAPAMVWIGLPCVEAGALGAAGLGGGLAGVLPLDGG